MPELKRNFTKGRMNRDLDERMVPNGEYRGALNIEVATSEGSNVGTMQTLKGNTAVTSLFGDLATCVGSITDEANNKLYWLVAGNSRNSNASTTYTHEEQDSSGSVNVTHDIYSDYIIEYDEENDETNYVAVEHYKVETHISNDSHGAFSDHIHVSNLGQPGDLRYIGIQPGMEIDIHTIHQGLGVTIKATVSKIENDDSATWNGWRVYPDWPDDYNYHAADGIKAGDAVTFKLPYNKRALGFSHFASIKPKKLITGINILDNLLFWTDGLTEPKKINIDRCKYGSTQVSNTYPNGTDLFNTLLVVNGQLPSDANARLGDYNSTQTQYNPYLPLTYREATVIRKSPTTPLVLTMSNTVRPDLAPIDGSTVVSGDVTLPLNASGTSDFFFTENGVVSGNKITIGEITPSLTFPQTMDWEVGDIIEFSPHDDEAGFNQEPLAILKISSVNPNRTIFTFEVMSLAAILQKPFIHFRAELQGEDPLFEFKFPRFAYRWKYEDGEYSTYSPFSDIAFLPEEFDYFPKKGYNLGMTNNLRYLLLSGFKPKTTPLDVVEIDILYKESNSPNVYTVETIKSPSSRVQSLGTYDFDGDIGWKGKITHPSLGEIEAPNTLVSQNQLVSQSALTGVQQAISGFHLYFVEGGFGEIDIMLGDSVSVSGVGSLGTISHIVYGTDANNEPISKIAIEDASGAAYVNAALGTGDIYFYRTIAKKPAIYLNDPQGSLQVETDMIHATLPANQLLRPWDNVPKTALAQEVSGNRIVYGNYIQNYDLKDHNTGDIVKPQFGVELTPRKNIRDNVQYDNRTALKHPTNGTSISWYSSLNNVRTAPREPERSIKSIRDYQVGLVYCDEYGRQTPIQAHPTGKIKVPKSYANDYNSINVRVEDSESYPEWATHFKYYVKENSNEYYNLAMDRFYDAQDGNVWLSFPSSERNKVDEETFLILKKQHDTDVFVGEDARYKILAIDNEAPDFVKTKYKSFGIVSTPFGSSGEPKFQGFQIDVPSGAFSSGGLGALSGEERVIRVSDATNISRWYDIASISDYGSYRRVVSDKSFGVDMAFTTDDGTNSGSILSGLSVEIAKKEMKNLPEFDGRFFVKIYRDGILENNILAFVSEKQYITNTLAKFGYQGTYGGCNPNRHHFVDMSGWGVYPGDPVPSGSWFVSKLCTEEQIADFSTPDQLSGLFNNNRSIHFQYHWGHAASSWWGVTNASNNMGASSANLNIGKKMRSNGQLFRWKGDTTIYRITSNQAWGVRNYNYNQNHPYYNDASNHSEVIRMNFEPALGDTGGLNGTGLDAVGQPCTGYNPFSSNNEGTGSGGWSDHWRANEYTASYHRSIEFLEEFIPSSSYSSDNPAIWETEPKEDVDVDIYNEMSPTLPIKKEWNPYLNRFEREHYYGSWRPLNYYNCFSFANGVESNRIRDDFNAVMIDKGPKVSTVLAEQYREERRKSGLIYSGIYNSTSGINRLNQFIQAEKITKDLNPTYGSIQKLWSKDTSLVAFCEDRVIGITANKDALYNADGNPQLIASNKVLGDAKPFAGDFGISTDPESFAVDQYRAYFTDKSRGAVMRFSNQGLTPISEMGMRDYFKDSLRTKNITLIGGYDDNRGLYNLTMKRNSLGSVGSNSSNSSSSSSSGTGTGVGTGTGTTSTSTTSTVINTGPIPTVGNALGNWFRYGQVVDNWAKAVEDGTWGSIGANPNNEPPGVVGATNPHGRGWTGIQAGGAGTHPAGVEHGKPGLFGANNVYVNSVLQGTSLSNSITIYFDSITSGYPFIPATDSTVNWNALIAALNTNGPGNVYLYQTALHANTSLGTLLPMGLQNWPNNWSIPHQPETVYAIQSIDHDPISGTYRVTADWLVGFSSYYDTNMFVWSLDGPFSTTTTTSNLSGNSPYGASCNEFGVTGNGGLGLTPGSVQAGDWVGFDSSNVLCAIAQDTTYIDVSVTEYSNGNVTSWLQDLLTGVSAGTPYNLSITMDYIGNGIYLAADEAVYTVSSVDAIATSSNSGSYYRIHLSWDFGAVILGAHVARICYYPTPIVASGSDDDGTDVYDYDDVNMNITVSFSENSKGWTSFKSWLQESAQSLNDKYFTFSGAELYQHHSNETRNNFYGSQYNSWVGVLFNDTPGSVKSFSALSYEGSQSKILLNTTDNEYYNNIVKDGWWADLIITDLETGFVPEFKEKEGKWFNYIRGNEANTLANLDVNQFSTQGIGRASAVTTDHDGNTATGIDLTIQDVGDND